MSSPPSARAAFSGQVRLLLAGMLLSSIGSGLTLSLLIVYLSSVRGIPTAIAGLVLSWIAVVSLALGPVGGWLIDRFGARWVLIGALTVEGIGVGMFALVTSAPMAFAVATLTAAGGAMIWPAQSTIIAELTDENDRQRVFGIQFMLLNLGLGIGGLIAASMVDLGDPSTFVRLYLLDAFSYLSYVVVLLMIRPPSVSRTELTADEAQAGYREVLSDRRLRRLALTSVILVTFGYGSLDGGLAAYITQIADMPVRIVGIVFAVNTGVIVVAQWWVLKFAQGRSRSTLMAVVGVMWGVSWTVMGGSALLAGGVAIVGLCSGMLIFALGETLWSPVAPALLNHLAPDHLRGRYNAVSAWSWSLGSAIGPAVAGVLIGAKLGGVWVALLLVGCLAGAACALTLRSLLTSVEDGRATAGSGMGGSQL